LRWAGGVVIDWVAVPAFSTMTIWTESGSTMSVSSTFTCTPEADPPVPTPP
jgi:hypothetical protein